MANKNFTKKKIQDTENSNFGNYQEGVGGGGSPEPKNPAQRAPGVNSEYREENNDTMQPRTDDGKFTYKSVNGKSIDPKYGPSRGKTVNPLLTGGENGIKIADVEKEFSSESGAYWDKYKDKWYRKGGEVVTGGDFKVRVASDAVWEVAKRKYNISEGGFEGEKSTFDETKKGRRSGEEKAAVAQAKSAGDENAVIANTSGGIKVKPGTNISSLPTTPAPTTPASPVAPTTGNTGNTGNAGGSANGGANGGAPSGTGDLKHSAAQLKEARDILTQNGIDVSGYTDEQLDAIFDDYFEEDNGSEQTDTDTTEKIEVSQENNAPKEEEESEETKKVRQMGFSN